VISSNKKPPPKEVISLNVVIDGRKVYEFVDMSR
jgi:hypothetical protein